MLLRLISAVGFAPFLTDCSLITNILTNAPPPPPTATGAALTLSPTFALPPSNVSGYACGSERWPVKTLSDADASQVNLRPRPSNIETLRSLPAPLLLPDDGRIPPTELETYVVQAQIQEFKLEDDDDIHVVVAPPDDPNETMIVELVDIGCNGAAGSSIRESMKDARDSFFSVCGEAKSSFQECDAIVEITGIGFFDHIHGQTGVAPNGIELHPVLAVTRPAASKTAP